MKFRIFSKWKLQIHLHALTPLPAKAIYGLRAFQAMPNSFIMLKKEGSRGTKCKAAIAS